MIDPPARDEPYPGLLPPVREQWRRLPAATRVALLGLPVVVAALLLALAPLFGVFITVLLAGSAAATVLYHKNRTDRHNAAVERGEIATVPDPHMQRMSPADLDPATKGHLLALGLDPGRLGRVVRFDGGWLVTQRSKTELAAVLGDDGGHARFDARVVTDLWAVSEYRAGRGRDSG